MSILRSPRASTNPPARKRRPRPSPRPRPNPRDSWPEWTSGDRWTTSEAQSDIDLTGFCDSSDHVAILEPTPREQAWKSGFDLGFAGENARPPADLADNLGLSWWVGYGNGETRREREELLIDRQPREYPEPCFEELVEACGADFARAYRAD
jgi:hypothetical protein